ncbi:hypothetical protein B0H16DRAFT_1475183 [Mycena metata]|uniref:Uncharacterized protein n=1 Tax=Mycena metata TaxID=1033252 RepID=A0AAD7HFK0_9AGAR|nr:hypothetical protein B0H16DRAFT_1475183 [Mycena metata]
MVMSWRIIATYGGVFYTIHLGLEAQADSSSYLTQYDSSASVLPRASANKSPPTRIPMTPTTRIRPMTQGQQNVNLCACASGYWLPAYLPFTLPEVTVAVLGVLVEDEDVGAQYPHANTVRTARYAAPRASDIGRRVVCPCCWEFEEEDTAICGAVCATMLGGGGGTYSYCACEGVERALTTVNTVVPQTTHPRARVAYGVNVLVGLWLGLVLPPPPVALNILNDNVEAEVPKNENCPASAHDPGRVLISALSLFIPLASPLESDIASDRSSGVPIPHLHRRSRRASTSAGQQLPGNARIAQRSSSPPPPGDDDELSSEEEYELTDKMVLVVVVYELALALLGNAELGNEVEVRARGAHPIMPLVHPLIATPRRTDAHPPYPTPVLLVPATGASASVGASSGAKKRKHDAKGSIEQKEWRRVARRARNVREKKVDIATGTATRPRNEVQDENWPADASNRVRRARPAP